MRYVVFECRKCEHHLYVENTDDLAKKLGKVSVLDCPNCGEEGFDNWVLVGVKREFPGIEEGGEQE